MEIYHWPQLCRFGLDDLAFLQVDFVGFLALHCQTLEHLRLQGVRVLQGTWMEPLQMMHKMPKLQALFMVELLATSPAASSLSPSTSASHLSRTSTDKDSV
jgi:hypothetical protein